MQITVSATKDELGVAAAKVAAECINAAIEKNGTANVILATGASQFEMLQSLVTRKVDWTKVTCFHLDEYIGMNISHPASFCKYLQERFVDQVEGPAAFHFVNGEGDANAECSRLGALIAQHPIDVACIGIGENGHLAFNDPPADFETDQAYLVVDLDEDCRKQQSGEGWFDTLDDVPTQAISMSIRQILKSACIVCSVPDERKAKAVQGCVEHAVSNTIPATIMQQHDDCHLFLDKASAGLLAQTKTGK